MPSVFDTDALYKLLVEQVEDYAIFALDPEGHVRTWNPGAERFKGYTAPEIIGRSFKTFYPPESIARRLPETLLERARTEGHAADEGWRVRKDGSRFWASVVITALRDHDGKLLGFAKITRDLSERRAAEEQQRRLAAEEASHAATLEKNRELETLTRTLQEQAAELEAQTEEAQSLAEELEQANEQLQSSLVETEEARDAVDRAGRFARGILESIADPFVVFDAAWHYRFLNTPAVHFMDPVSDASRFIGESLWQLYPALLGTEAERQMRRALDARTPLSFETFYPDRNEWYMLHCYPLPDGGLAVQWRDITDRKRSDEAAHYLGRASDILNQSLDYETTLQELARLVVPKLADWCAVDIADEHGKLRQLAVAHVDPEKVALARDLNERYPPDPAAATGSYQVFRTGQPALYSEIPQELLLDAAQDDEHRRIIRELGLRSALVVPLTTADGPLGVLTLVSAESGRKYDERDLALATELGHRAAVAVHNARLHQAALRAQRAAEEANRAKSDFLATMSHELRTPLNAIAGYVDLLRLGIKGKLSEEQDEYLARVQRSQHYLLSLIQDVLNFARIEAGHVDLHFTRVDVGGLLAEIEELVLPQLRDANLEFVREQAPPGAIASADAERVRQILLNLLSNAIKFTPKGGLVAVSSVVLDDVVRVTVRDTGVGIPADKQASIFEPFIQLMRDNSGGAAGAGLGLAISRDLARAMHGDLTVQSEPGRGSSFTLELPRTTDA
jgi:PAS domain S-box-containing protein